MFRDLLACFVFIAEHVCDFDEAESFAERFSRQIAHAAPPLVVTII